MTLADISDLSQTIAAVAVIISLVYAGLQFRIYAQAAREARLATSTADLQDFRRILATDADCARIYRDGLADMRRLDSLEQWRFGALMQLVVTNFQYNVKYSDVVDAELLKASVASIMQRPGARQWWAKGRMTVDREARAVIDAAVADGAARMEIFKGGTL
jgi:hypothetical protein